MKADEWIPVTERIPADGSDILVYCDDGEESRIVACNYDNGVWFDCVFNTVMAFKNITHWMPLPEPPPERKTAHWVFGNTMGHSWMKCSECCVSQSGQTGCWTYCPNCGAEMKGETEVEIN